MSGVTGNTRVFMVRENLQGIPDYASPSGYSVRWYQAGDEDLWLKIHLVADKLNSITPELFAREFGDQPSLLAQRQCFLFDAHRRPVGTATAWFNDNFNGGSYGRVHWVAIVPEQQGRGLGKALMTIVCHRLRELGHTRAYLTTSTARISAINLYRHFGFVPLIRAPDDATIWRELNRYLKNPCPVG